MPDSPERRVQRADWGSLSVVLAVGVAHAHFALVDERLPKDMGLYFARLPETWGALGDPATWSEAMGVLGTPGGWYVLLLALLMRVVGRGPELLQVLDGSWVMLAVAMGALCGRRLGGPRAGLAAASLIATPSMVVILGRTSWIHVPELALVLTALYALLSDPELRTRRWTAVTAVCLGLAVAMRPSALVWVLTLAPLIPRAWRASRARVLTVALSVAIGTLILVPTFTGYLEAKLDARPRYAEHMPGLLQQLHSTVGLPVLVLGGVGLVLAWGHLRREHALVLVAWLALPLALVGIFLAGLDNFPFVLAGLALVAGVGLARRRAATLAAACLFAVLWSTQFVRLPYALNTPLFWLTGQNNGPGPGNLVRPYTGFAANEVLALVNSTCDPLAQCTVVVDQGLFRPYAEDPGHHELFLAGKDLVNLVWIAGGDVPGHLHALANYDCGERDLPWRARFPESIDALMALVDAHDLEPAWEGDTQPGCRLLWLTPGGDVPRPELLPPAVAGGAPGDAFSPEGPRPHGPGLPDGPRLPEGPRLPDDTEIPWPPPGPMMGPQPTQPPPEAPRPDGITKPVHLDEVPPIPARDQLEAHRVKPGHSMEE